MAKKKWLESVVVDGKVGLADLQQLFKKDASKLEEQETIEAKRKKMSRVERAVSHSEFKEKMASKLGKHREAFKHMYNPEGEKQLINAKIILTTRTGKKMPETSFCQSCGIKTSNAWQFSNSNHGPVILCAVCKNIAINDSFDGGDAMSLKVNHAYQRRR